MSTVNALLCLIVLYSLSGYAVFDRTAICIIHSSWTSECTVFNGSISNIAQVVLYFAPIMSNARWTIRIASIEHITADTIRIISMYYCSWHYSYYSVNLYWNHRCSHLIPVPMVQWLECSYHPLWMVPMNIGYGDTETDSLNAERETMLTLDSS